MIVVMNYSYVVAYELAFLFNHGMKTVLIWFCPTVKAYDSPSVSPLLSIEDRPPSFVLLL